MEPSFVLASTVVPPVPNHPTHTVVSAATQELPIIPIMKTLPTLSLHFFSWLIVLWTINQRLTTTLAFAPIGTTTVRPTAATPIRTSTSQLFLSNDNKSSKKPFDENLRSKLVSEAIAPWRTVRLFLYGTLGAGALIGGLITLAGTAAALQGARPDLDLTEQVCGV